MSLITLTMIFFGFLLIKIIINNLSQQRKKKQSLMEQHGKQNIKNPESRELPNDQAQKQVFQCQCGKQYQSFAAIYLHFRTKHDIKLSTKPNEVRRKVFQNQGFRKFVYSLDNDLKQVQDLKAQTYHVPGHNSPPSTSINPMNPVATSSNSVTHLKQCIDSYLASSFQSPKWIYRMLMQFLIEELEQNRNFSIDKVPESLNRFVMDYIPNYNRLLRVRSSTWRKLCVQLQKFCGWLREQKLTDLIVIYDGKEQK